MEATVIDLSHISFEGVAVGAGAGVAAARRPRAQRPAARSAEPQPAPHPFLVWLLAQAGLDHRAYRTSALERRLPACLRQLRTTTPEEARALLEQRPERVPFALGTILIGVSEFFRDEAVFRALGEEVLPGLLREKAALRICSVGCSNGQELYSVAIQLAELGALERCQLLGLDCRAEAVARAEAGLFTANEVKNIREERLRRFFHPEDGRWRVAPALRAATRWRGEDLFGLPTEREPFDLILCRNVMIYLAPAHAARAWELLRARLRNGGFLVTGKAEEPPPSLPFLRIARSIHRAHS